MFATDQIVPSLESILEDSTSDSFKEFAAYLDQSYCSENLAFWIATQDYYQDYRNQTHALSCKRMINLYIYPNSTQEINIPCDMRQKILDDYNQSNYHFNIFDEAAEAVLELMRVNSFLPWITHGSSPATNDSLSRSYSSSFETMEHNSNNHHNSWPAPKSSSTLQKTKFGVNNSSSTNSLSALSTSLSFTDKWSLMKLKKMSRRSCSFLDYSPTSMLDDDNHDDDSSSAVFDTTNPLSVSLSTTPSVSTSKYHYKSMLKRVRKSLLGATTDSGPNTLVLFDEGHILK